MRNQLPLLVHHSQPRYNSLPKTSIDSVTLHQRPVGVTFAVFAPKATSQIHSAMLRIAQTKSRGLVVTTSAFRASNAGIRIPRTQTKVLSPLASDTNPS